MFLSIIWLDGCALSILFPLFVFLVGLVDELLVLELGVVSFELVDGLLGGLGVGGIFESCSPIVLLVNFWII